MKFEASPRPAVSVIISTFNPGSMILHCLESLVHQSSDESFEVIVIDSSTDNTRELIAAQFPWVQLHHYRQRKYAGDARNIGIAAAQSPIIAFLDADCVVEPSWVSSVIEAHRSEHLVIGGIIDNKSRDTVVGWAYYFSEFSLWLPHAGQKEIAEIAGCCLSMKASAYSRYGPFIRGTYCSDSAFQWKIRKAGHVILSVPSIRVYHAVPGDFTLRAMLEHIFEHRNCFSSVRVHEKNMSVPQRAAFAVFCLVLPFILYPVLTTRVIRSGTYLVPFLYSSHGIILGLFARAWGEFFGYLFPRPPDDNKKTDS